MRRWTGLSVHKAQSQPVTRSKCRKHGFLVQKVEQTRTSAEPIKHKLNIQPRLDPYTLVAPELSHLRGQLLGLLGSAHPGLDEIAKYYFLHPSKQLRSLIVLLFSRATNGLGRCWEQKQWIAENEVTTGRSEELDQPLKSPDILNNWHPSMPNNTATFETVFELQNPGQYHKPRDPPPLTTKHRMPRLVSPPLLLPVQIRLAQIVEMIHIASLLHDGVLDQSISTPTEGFGNKLSILGGDFLLGRASAALSRLGESEVVELIAGVISNLVEGEMLRMQGVQNGVGEHIEGPGTLDDAWNIYLRKTYLKTASLMAKSARAAVILGGSREGDIWKDVAYAYGRNLGIAFQIMEDTLDFESDTENLQPGLATAPIIYAWEEHPELHRLVQRNFSNEGDMELAIGYVRRSSGLERARILALTYTDKAREVLGLLPDSDTKIALDVLANLVVTRTW